jgi:hypothetical protein
LVVLALVVSQDAVDAGADHYPKGVLSEVGVLGVVEGIGEVPGQPGAFVELAGGSSPASSESWPGDVSIMIGVRKNSRTWDQAKGIVIDCPLDRGQELARQQVRRIRGAIVPAAAH